MKLVVHAHPMDPNNPKDLDMVLLCSKPSQIATRYTKMIAYGNHYRMEDPKNGLLQTYDSRITSMFDVPTHDVANVFVNCVRVLKDILKFNYSPIHTLIIICRCEWMKREDNRWNPTYVRDDIGFFMMKFRHKLPLMVEPFIFPSQVT